jgi:DNA-binding PadR family transcriptional regulator
MTGEQDLPDQHKSRDHHHERGGLEERLRGKHGERGRHGGPKGRGDVRAAVLMLLGEQPTHGYDLILQITTRSGGAWRPSPGSVYPALQLLEDQELIRSEQAEGRRVYDLTEAGRAHIEQHRDELAQVWAGVIAGGDDPAHELRDLLDPLVGAVRQVMHAGTATQIAAAGDVLTGARRQIYRILADDFVGGTPPDTGGS